MKQVTYQIIP